MLSAITLIPSSVSDSSRPAAVREAGRVPPSSRPSDIGTTSAFLTIQSLERRLALLALSDEHHVAGNLAVLADRLGELVGLIREVNESNDGFVRRFAGMIAKLAPEERSALEGRFAKLVKGFQVDMILAAVRNPAGAEAARVSVALQVNRIADQGPGTRRVISSYKQNGSSAQSPTDPEPPSGLQRAPLQESSPQTKMEMRREPPKMLTEAGTPSGQRTEATRGAGTTPFVAEVHRAVAQQELSRTANGREAFLFDSSRPETPSAPPPERYVSPAPMDGNRTNVPPGKEPGVRTPASDISDSARSRTTRPDDVGTRAPELRSRSASVDADRPSPATRDRLAPRSYPDGRQGVTPPSLNPGFSPWLEESEGEPGATTLTRLLGYVLEHGEQTASGAAEVPPRAAAMANVGHDGKAGASTPVIFDQEVGGDEVRDARSQSMLLGGEQASLSATGEGRLPAATVLRDNAAFPFFGYAVFDDDVAFSEQETKRSRGGKQEGDDGRRGEDGSEDQSDAGETTESEGNGENDVDEAIADPVSASGSETVLAHYLTMSTLT